MTKQEIEQVFKNAISIITPDELPNGQYELCVELHEESVDVILQSKCEDESDSAPVTY